MARILAIDYGQKRCGVATTDPLQIIVNGLDTINTEELLDFIEQYLTRELVDKIVLGLPQHKDGADTYNTPLIRDLGKKLEQLYPTVIIDFHDEAFTSKTAKQLLFQSGMKKSKRREKKEVDKMSAVVILQEYLHHI